MAAGAIEPNLQRKRHRRMKFGPNSRVAMLAGALSLLAALLAVDAGTPGLASSAVGPVARADLNGVHLVTRSSSRAPGALTPPKGGVVEVTGFTRVALWGNAGPVVAVANGRKVELLRATLADLALKSSSSDCQETLVPFTVSFLPSRRARPTMVASAFDCAGLGVSVVAGNARTDVQDDCAFESAALAVLPRSRAAATREVVRSNCQRNGRAARTERPVSPSTPDRAPTEGPPQQKSTSPTGGSTRWDPHAAFSVLRLRGPIAAGTQVPRQRTDHRTSPLPCASSH